LKTEPALLVRHDDSAKPGSRKQAARPGERRKRAGRPRRAPVLGWRIARARIAARDPAIHAGRSEIVMKQMTRAIVLASGLALAGTSAVWGQSPDEPARAFVSVGGGYQSAERTVDTTGSFTLYDEPGSFAGSRKVGKGPFFEIGGGAHVFGQVSVGVAYSRYQKPTDVPFTVIAPHPLFFSQPRTVTLNVNDLGHTENAVHIQLFYQIFSSSRYDASVSAGPSIFSVKQDSVEAVTATETGTPYTAVNLGATFESASKTAVGFNVGFDLNYRLTGGFGAGLFVRYTGASADLPWAKVKVGGPQFGLGLRYRF
jgi:hypothetical protein